MKPQGSHLAEALALFIAMSTGAQSIDPLTNWQAVATSGPGLRGIAHMNGRFVAGGGTNIVVSTNGSNWFAVPGGVANNGFEGILAVDAAAGQFVAVGGATGLILSSPDGMQWTRRLTLPGIVELWAVTHGNGVFVAVGYRNSPASAAVVATSPDGINWEARDLPFFTTPRNIAYGNGMFVAAGSPISMRSTNGQDWMPINSLLAQGIAFGNGRFVATLATNGFSSTDGVTWTQFQLPGTDATSQNYYTAGFGNGTFITGGHYGAKGLLAAIGDGPARPLASTSVRVGFNTVNMAVIRDVIFVDGRYYLADQGGVIWRSGVVTPAAPPRISRIFRDNAQTHLTISTIPGFRYTVETANAVDATNWERLTPGPVFVDTDEWLLMEPRTDSAARFYRARVD